MRKVHTQTHIHTTQYPHANKKQSQREIYKISPLPIASKKNKKYLVVSLITEAQHLHKEIYKMILKEIKT